MSRFFFNCSNGCGPCGVKVREFENYRSETPDGALIERRCVPELVSTCCGSEVDIWDEVAQDLWAGVVISNFRSDLATLPTPTATDEAAR